MLIPELLPEHAFGQEGYGSHSGYHSPGVVVLCYQAHLLRMLCDRSAVELDNTWPLRSHPYRQLYRSRHGDFGAMHLEIGAAVSQYIISVLSHFGSSRFVLAGSAGALSEDASGIELFRVSTAECAQIANKGGADVLHASCSQAFPSCTPVHALTVSEFFRAEAMSFERSSSLPCVIEMEAYHAFELGSRLNVGIEAVGYISDRFQDGRWRRNEPVTELSRALVDCLAADLLAPCATLTTEQAASR